MGIELQRITRTFPTAASPSNTSFTLLVGFGALGAPSAMVVAGFGKAKMGTVVMVCGFGVFEYTG